MEPPKNCTQPQLNSFPDSNKNIQPPLNQPSLEERMNPPRQKISSTVTIKFYTQYQEFT